MSELPDAIHSQILIHCERGDSFAENGEHINALSEYSAGMALLPEPKDQWEAWQWIMVAIGDLRFGEGKWREAFESFEAVIIAPDGANNPFVQLRFGQSAYELDKEKMALEHLARAYMMEGKEIFEDEDPAYFKFLQNNLDHIK